MSSDEKTQMDEFGITSKTETIYFYKSFRYSKLKDAVNYAKIDLQTTESNTRNEPSIESSKR